MPWVNTSTASCLWECNNGDVAKIAERRTVASKRQAKPKLPGQKGHGGFEMLYDVPMDQDMCERMYRAAPVAAIMEHWRQWAVEVGLASETDEIERLVIDIDAGEDRAHFWVERKGDMRQLAVKPPKVELL